MIVDVLNKEIKKDDIIHHVSRKRSYIFGKFYKVIEENEDYILVYTIGDSRDYKNRILKKARISKFKDTLVLIQKRDYDKLPEQVKILFELQIGYEEN